MSFNIPLLVSEQHFFVIQIVTIKRKTISVSWFGNCKRICLAVTTFFSSFLSPPEISSKEIVDKLGDLSKIDISAEVTKLLTSMNQNKTMLPTTESSTGSPSTKPESGSSPSASDSAPSDPRLSRQVRVLNYKLLIWLLREL